MNSTALTRSASAGTAYREDRLESAVLHILTEIQRNQNTREVSAGWLNPLLYFIDFDFYELHGRSLTGETYVKEKETPSSGHLHTVLSNLVEYSSLTAAQSLFKGFDSICYSVCSKPDLSIFDRFEIRHMNQVIEELGKYSIKHLMEHARGDVPYIEAAYGAVLDYDRVFSRMEDYALTSFLGSGYTGESISVPRYRARMKELFVESEGEYNKTSVEMVTQFINSHLNLRMGALVLGPDGNFSIHWDEGDRGLVSLRFESPETIRCLTFKGDTVHEKQFAYDDYEGLFGFIDQHQLSGLICR